MRSLPIFSESSFSLSFFLTTPAKKPRTECACQPVTSMMVAIVVPLAWRSSDSTVSCFVGESPAAVVLVRRAVLGARLIPRVFFAVRFANFDFCLLVAIQPSLVSTTASRAATVTSPAIRQGNRRGEARRHGALRPTTHAPLDAEVQRIHEQSCGSFAGCRIIKMLGADRDDDAGRFRARHEWRRWSHLVTARDP